MEHLTVEEAKRAAVGAAKWLAEKGFAPYSVSDANVSSPDWSEEPRLDISIDVTDSTSKPAGTHSFPVSRNSDSPMFLFLCLRCGLLDMLPSSWRARIAYWKWDEPAQWQAERVAWRTKRSTLVNAATRDVELSKLRDYARLKQRFSLLEMALAGTRDEERQSVLTDDEVLAARARREDTEKDPPES